MFLVTFFKLLLQMYSAVGHLAVGSKMALTNSSVSAKTDIVSDEQLDELCSIKAAFPNRCRISSDTGEFIKVITVQPENMDATIKFHLPGMKYAMCNFTC